MSEPTDKPEPVAPPMWPPHLPYAGNVPTFPPGPVPPEPDRPPTWPPSVPDGGGV